MDLWVYVTFIVLMVLSYIAKYYDEKKSALYLILSTTFSIFITFALFTDGLTYCCNTTRFAAFNSIISGFLSVLHLFISFGLAALIPAELSENKLNF
jgi:Na+/proline symporter